MTTDYMRGVQYVPAGPQVLIDTPRTSVIGLVGTAPIQSVAEGDRTINEVVLITSKADAVRYFGAPRPGYTLPLDLLAWDDYSAGPVLAVNVFDPDFSLQTITGAMSFDGDVLSLPQGTQVGNFNAHVAVVEGTANYHSTLRLDGATRLSESRTFASDQIDLGDTSVTVLSVKSPDGATTYALTTDYTISGGVITREGGGAIAADATVTVTWEVGVDVISVPRTRHQRLSPSGDAYDTGEDNPDIVLVQSTDRRTAYTLTTDYTVSGGVITREGSGSIPEGVDLQVSYTKVSVTKVTSTNNRVYALGTDYTVNAGVVTRVATGAIAPGKALRVSYTEPDIVFTEGRDYTVDAEAGTITRVTTGAFQRIAADATVTVTYEYPTPVTAQDIIGVVTDDDTATGMQAFINSHEERGFRPSWISCPGFSSDPLVAQEMGILADKLLATAVIDALPGISIQQAIESRGEGGVSESFFTSSTRTHLVYPRYLGFDPSLGKRRYMPYSRTWVPHASKSSITQGYWLAPSNQPLLGVFGFETKVGFSHGDPAAPANLINGSGIATYYSSYGTGYFSWGARSAAFPSSADVKTFLAVQRSLDVLRFALEQSMIRYIDRPIAESAKGVPDDTNEFLDAQVVAGVYTSARCWFDPKINPPLQVNQGILAFRLDLAPSISTERLQFVETIDRNAIARDVIALVA